MGQVPCASHAMFLTVSLAPVTMSAQCALKTSIWWVLLVLSVSAPASPATPMVHAPAVKCPTVRVPSPQDRIATHATLQTASLVTLTLPASAPLACLDTPSTLLMEHAQAPATSQLV